VIAFFVQHAFEAGLQELAIRPESALRYLASSGRDTSLLELLNG
jgi:hypothetical protein